MRIVGVDLVTRGEVGKKYDQIGSARMAHGWIKQSPTPCRDQPIGDQPAWRRLPRGAGEEFPVAGRIGKLGCIQFSNPINVHLIGDQSARWCDERALGVFGKGRHRVGSKVKGSVSRAIEPPAKHRRTCAARWLACPFGAVESIENTVRREPNQLHPVAPFLRSSRNNITASV